ncbi:MAG: purine nucleoside permease [Acidobacteria bacterium]|nr:purine nucleoside permease [Acidobacteriota bacterium]
MLIRTLVAGAVVAGALAGAPAPAHAQTTPIPVKVVVVTMFEVGNDTGDRPGELQFWVERKSLDRVLPFPQGYRDLRMNGDGVLAVLTGVGNVRSAATIMALGLDPRFDLRQAYWVVAGIAGGDPADTSMGAAAWAEWVVDGDLGHEIDAREAPADWPTGFVPLRKTVPYEMPRANADTFEAFRLNPSLVDWAYQLTRSVELVDSDVMQKERLRYTEAAARRAPFVLKGDTLSSSTFWTGARLDQWANQWVQYHTGGSGRFTTTAMEDTGTLQSLTWLARAGKVDLNRILVLRTVSNFDQPPPGMTAAEGLARTNSGVYLGFLPALESAYRVGNTVVDYLVAHWNTVKDTPPTVAR